MQLGSLSFSAWTRDAEHRIRRFTLDPVAQIAGSVYSIRRRESMRKRH